MMIIEPPQEPGDSSTLIDCLFFCLMDLGRKSGSVAIQLTIKLSESLHRFASCQKKLDYRVKQ